MRGADCQAEPREKPETLRDRFAMVAVDMFREGTVRAADRKGALRQLAQTAYLFADAMMEARK